MLFVRQRALPRESPPAGPWATRLLVDSSRSFGKLWWAPAKFVGNLNGSILKRAKKRHTPKTFSFGVGGHAAPRPCSAVRAHGCSERGTMEPRLDRVLRGRGDDGSTNRLRVEEKSFNSCWCAQCAHQVWFRSSSNVPHASQGGWIGFLRCHPWLCWF